MVSLLLMTALVVVLLRRNRMGVAPGSSASGQVARRLSISAVRFVGAATCATCHAGESNLWRGSHHQLVMQAATSASVLGAFNNVNFINDSVTSTFFRRGSRFMVRTDGPDGGVGALELHSPKPSGPLADTTSPANIATLL
jgi:hypothetical protein